MVIDKLHKDLIFMWSSRLYRLTFVSPYLAHSLRPVRNTPAIFASHQFILVSSSPYFHAQLLSWVPRSAAATAPGDPLTVTLPSPPFIPALLHFTLGYISTDTLIFAHCTYDLDTAFAILRTAIFLSLEFEEYECITGTKWGTGWCHCHNVAIKYLDRGAHRAFLGLFSHGQHRTSQWAHTPMCP
ncbi:hypothetical protein PAXINDRAFT_18718 [Paxillus involutus ATCC 200175]|uniref:BTB domain-containing protein n=1 Tax=Paxillus involutus ATCC 200175 TaxID=664439 RepID=A0A0C9TAM7_PAXIN|nr:hypothetical protein PAXINDRAFT_18718 [Paxillus involutus ATCC 200175]